MGEGENIVNIEDKQILKDLIISKMLKIDGCWISDLSYLDLQNPLKVQFSTEQRINKAKLTKFMYYLFKGAHPSNCTLWHNCGYKDCINPDHLTAMPQAEGNKWFTSKFFKGKTHDHPVKSIGLAYSDKQPIQNLFLYE